MTPSNGRRPSFRRHAAFHLRAQQSRFVFFSIRHATHSSIIAMDFPPSQIHEDNGDRTAQRRICSTGNSLDNEQSELTEANNISSTDDGIKSRDGDNSGSTRNCDEVGAVHRNDPKPTLQVEFMGLPTEIRQTILSLAIHRPLEEYLYMRPASGLWIPRTAMSLVRLNSQLNQDMLYVVNRRVKMITGWLRCHEVPEWVDMPGFTVSVMALGRKPVRCEYNVLRALRHLILCTHNTKEIGQGILMIERAVEGYEKILAMLYKEHQPGQAFHGYAAVPDRSEMNRYISES